MKATFRLPSKAVQYGYVEIDVEVGDDAQAETIGHVYYAYVEAFQKGEKAQKAVSGPASPVLVDVLDDKPSVFEAKGKALLDNTWADDDNGHSGTIEDEPLSGDHAKEVIEDILGPTTAVDDKSAPWDNEPPAAKKKPWEKGASKAPAVKVDLFG